MGTHDEGGIDFDRRQMKEAFGRLEPLRRFLSPVALGLENVPREGGGLLVAWHPNGLIDPGLIVATFPRQVVFGARHGLFKWPGLGSLMRSMDTVPLYRSKDVRPGDDPEEFRAANRKGLEALAAAIRGG